MPVESAKMFLVGNGERLVMRICCYVSFSYKLKMFWCYGKIKRSKGQLPVAVYL
jgi:hypothetical protein